MRRPSPEALHDWLDGLAGYERFVMASASSISASILLMLHFIDQGTWLTAFTITVGAFIGANAYTHGVSLRADANVEISKVGAGGTAY